jgi:hypothetical protein
MGHIPEQDWKYLRSIHDEMLEKLCRRINQGAARIAKDSSLSQHERYLRLYRYLQEQDEIVAHCFND